MNSRERILAALEHRETNRVPTDFSGHRSSGIAAIAYPKLRKYLGLPDKPTRVYDIIQQLAIVPLSSTEESRLKAAAAFS